MARFTLYGAWQYEPTIFDGFNLPEGLDKDALIDSLIRECGELYPYHQVPAMLKTGIKLWSTRRLHQWARMYEAIMHDYEIFENYDRIEEYTSSDSERGTIGSVGSATDSTEIQGENTTVNIRSGSSSVTKSGSDDLTKSGGVATQHGLTTTHSVAAFNASSVQPESSDVNSGTDTTTYNNQKDSHVFNNLKEQTDYNGLQDNERSTTGSSSSGESNTSSTETRNLTNSSTHTLRAHGNIGVTQNTQMALAELEYRKFDLYNSIVREFEKEFLVQIY